MKRPTRSSAPPARPTRSGSRPEMAAAEDGAGDDRASEAPEEELFAGRYRLDRKLGQGGMGSVYLATDVTDGRLTAIKILDDSADDDVTVSRFEREARLIGQLQHPHIVQLYDVGACGDALYIAMEFLDGEPLRHLIAREAPLTVERAARIGAQIADALEVAHALGVIHRDLKPDNVMITEVSGRSDVVKLLDFGIAKVRKDDPSQETIQTMAGMVVGTLRYISPEQVQSGEVSPQTDLYTLGTILYELVTGRRVFEYASPADCAIAHLRETPRRPDRDGVPLEGPVIDVIMQCLEKAPAARPRSAGDVATRLRAGATAARQPVDDATAMFSIDDHALASLLAEPSGPGQDASAAATVMMDEGAADAVKRAVATNRAARDLALPGPASARRGEDLDPTATRPGVLLDTARRKPARRHGPLWVVLALVVVGLAGAAIYLFVIHPSQTRSEAAGQGETPGEVEHVAQDPGSALAPTGERGAQPEGEEVAPTPVAEEPAVEEAKAPAEPPPPPEPVRWEVTIDSRPSGAEVLRGGEAIGETPSKVTWAEDEAAPMIRLRKQGYHDVDVQLTPADRGATRRIPLNPR